MTHSFRIIRRLARELKYLPLELLWNYPITINSLSTLEQDIRRELGSIVPTECSLLTTVETIYGTLAKYDFLDLTFRVPDALLLQSNYQVGISLLRQLLPQKQNEQAHQANLNETREEDLNFSETFLEQLIENLDVDLTLCRMRLESRAPRTFEERIEMTMRTAPTLILPEGYFPHHFMIQDAGLTNAQGVWFYKYFYL
ncbi:MAG TPA: hypothetical protein V6D33_06245 [Cyanophyceae cyanobacterium]